MEILRVENLTFSYPEAAKPALSQVSFSLKEGEFAVLCGLSGCGKSTLLRLLKKELAPYGSCTGEITIGVLSGKDKDASMATETALLRQNPDSQIVTDVVWHELAFALENMGTPQEIIRKRVAEIATFFGMEGWYHRKVDELSGGQKQLLNLASVMTLAPQVLLLDEPTAQLDPIATGEFIHILERLHRELGITILIAEHHLEEVLPLADRVLILEEGRLSYDGSPAALSDFFQDKVEHPLLPSLPAASRVFRALLGEGALPISVADGRSFVRAHYGQGIPRLERTSHIPKNEPATVLKEIWFRYERNAPDVLRSAELTIYQGERLCLLGGNGSGKTTLLSLLAGIRKPYAGSITLFGRKLSGYRPEERYRNNIGYLPQNPREAFVGETVLEDWKLACRAMEYSTEEGDAQIAAMAEKLSLTELLRRHPSDLSGGELQRAALGKVLLLKPRLLLLDEPTKGIDARFKMELTKLLKALSEDGITVVTVTHDVEFAAETAERVGLVFDGEVTSVQETTDFFTGNTVYTTEAARIARNYYEEVTRTEELIALCRLNGRGEQA
ncbi:MAG: ATP-binding cassette domain-containing protein [Lachnospiraceae bacterium]|nr:ATP-binding cassette domain-containing protein [Lachnospiraceae bacterium]